MEEIFLSKSREDTQSFADSFARSHLVQGETLTDKAKIILLYGNLGAGKTTFVQGLAKGLGVQKRIISPTFIILRTYSLKTNTFYHVDLYRLTNEKEIEGLGLLELLKNPENIIVIEWPERLGSLKPQNAWQLSFETTGENERKIVLSL